LLLWLHKQAELVRLGLLLVLLVQALLLALLPLQPYRNLLVLAR
jgi:hypothetical protein